MHLGIIGVAIGIIFACLLVVIIFLGMSSMTHILTQIFGVVLAAGLAALSFIAYRTYRFTRLLFSMLAFLLFAAYLGYDTYFDELEFEEEQLDYDPYSHDNIKDYFLVLGLGFFAIGSLYKIKRS